MSAPRDSTASLLVVACFSRHPEALTWAEEQMQPMYGKIRLRSADYDFHHTRYYEPEMGPGLRKRLVVFEPLAPPDCLPDVKRRTIELERALAASNRFAEARPLNLDPGLLQLGKFLLASTKDQGHRIYLRDGIFAEVTLRFHAGAFEPWPWTYADYREPEVMRFLTEARGVLQGLLR
jgi:Domain of unknown function (DUF4416)